VAILSWNASAERNMASQKEETKKPRQPEHALDGAWRQILPRQTRSSMGAISYE
jgi:hypothetical protein